MAAYGELTEHGDLAGYRYECGCRCDLCQSAHAARMRRRRAERYAMDPKPPYVVHGKPATYGNWGCRCRPCLDAHNQALCDLRAKKKREAQWDAGQ